MPVMLKFEHIIYGFLYRKALKLWFITRSGFKKIAGGWVSFTLLFKILMNRLKNDSFCYIVLVITLKRIIGEEKPIGFSWQIGSTNAVDLIWNKLSEGNNVVHRLVYNKQISIFEVTLGTRCSSKNICWSRMAYALVNFSVIKLLTLIYSTAFTTSQLSLHSYFKMFRSRSSLYKVNYHHQLHHK